MKVGMLAVDEIVVIRTVIGICFLVFVAKLLAGICQKYKVPGIVGEVLAGMTFGPYALGGMISFFGEPILRAEDPVILSFVQIGGIIVLFLAGLHLTFADFLHAGIQSFIIGAIDVTVSFVIGIFISLVLGYSWTVALIVSSALAVTGIAIVMRILEELNLMHEGAGGFEESRMIVNVAVIDTILGLSILSVVTSVTLEGEIVRFPMMIVKVVQIFAIGIIILALSSIIMPRVVSEVHIWEFKGTIETIAIAVCFGLAFLTAYLGLSPIVGAFIAGVAVAGSRILVKAKGFIESLNLIFGTMFFAMMGAHIEPQVFLHLNYLVFFGFLVVAVLMKIVSCGLPSIVYFRDVNKGLTVAVGMIARGEVGLLVAGMGFAVGVIPQDIYVTLVVTCLATTIVSPFLMKAMRQRANKQREERGFNNSENMKRC
jgi:Kef-type K+ transport system membrane component KefB